MSDSVTMHVKVYAPFKTYFDGPAISLSGVNDTGPFDILPRHKNFISLLKAGSLAIKTPDKHEVEVQVVRGVIHVKANKATVFLDI